MAGNDTDPGRKDRATWRSFPIFRAVDDAVLDELPKAAQRRSWRPGEVIFQKGDPGAFLIAQLSGRTKLSNLSQNGRELLIRFAEPGDLVGEIACLDGGERSSTATAVTEVQAFTLGRREYRAIATRFPALHEAAIAHLGALLRGTNDRLESVSLYQLHARFARFLLISLQQMNGEELAPFEMLSLKVNQTDLGLLVGASRPKLNRMLQEFREQGVLEQEGQVWRCNVVALRQISEE
jgi:CRP/FNR family transcriptional regulator, cyclic AMP receptor protein